MAVRLIPLPTSDDPLLTQEVTLEGRTYGFRFDWNQRLQLWAMAISVEGEDIVTGLALVPDYEFIGGLWSEDKPPGQLILTNEAQEIPTLDNIQDSQLVYYESE